MGTQKEQDDDDASTVLAGLHLLDGNNITTTENDSENQIRKEVKLALDDMISAIETESDQIRPVVSTVIAEIIDIIEKTAELASILDFTLDEASVLSLDEEPQMRQASSNNTNLAHVINDSNNNDEGTVCFSVSTASRKEDLPAILSRISSSGQGDSCSRLSSQKEDEQKVSVSNASVGNGSIDSVSGSNLDLIVPGTLHSDQMRTLESHGFGKSQPIMPKAFEMGIANPSLLLTDEKYWLAKTLKARSDDDKRRYRLRKLAKLRDFYYKNKRGKLYAYIQDAKTEALLLKADFIEDLNDFLEPLMVYVDKMLDIIRPEMQKFQHQLAIALKMVVIYAYKVLEEAKSRQQGLQKLFPATLPASKYQQQIRHTHKIPEDNNEMNSKSDTTDAENDSQIRQQVEEYLSELISFIEKSTHERPTSSQDDADFKAITPSLKSSVLESTEENVSKTSDGSEKIISFPKEGIDNSFPKKQNHVTKDENKVDDDAETRDKEEEEDQAQQKEDEEKQAQQKDDEEEQAQQKDDEEEQAQQKDDEEELALEKEHQEEEETEENDEDIERINFQSSTENDPKSDLNGKTFEKLKNGREDDDINIDKKEAILSDQQEINKNVSEQEDEEEGEKEVGDEREEADEDEEEDDEDEDEKEDEESSEEEDDIQEKSGTGNQSQIAEESVELDANSSGVSIGNAAIDSPTSKDSSPLSSGNQSSSRRKRNRYQAKNILHPSSYDPVQRIGLIAQIFEKELANEVQHEQKETIQDATNSTDSVMILTPHDRAMERIRKMKLYDDEILNIMDSLIQDVEEHVLLSEQPAMVPNESQLAEDDKRWKKMIFGSEISVIVRITPEQRQAVEGLLELKSEDIGHFLKQQCHDPFSVLNQGSITQHIVDVSFKPLFQKANAVSSWYSYWIQRVHPSFFNYTATKRIDLKTGKTIKNKVRFKEDNAPTSKYGEGLSVLNPLETLDERTKEAMMALNKKPVLLPPGERLKRYEDQPDMKNQVSSDVIDFDVDEFGKEFESKGVQLYRPNMETLTDKDVRRCYRVYQAFKEAHDKEMAKGLVNNGLLPSQHQAMKDMATAFRIYRSARQKMQQNVRRRQKQGLEIDEFAPPPLHVTNINQDLFDTWIEEVREEDRIRLQAKREQKEKMKEALQVEAELRRETAKRKRWVLENFVKFYQEGKPKQATDGMLSEDASRISTPAVKEKMPDLQLLLPTNDNASIAENSLAYSISTVGAPTSDFRHQLPERTLEYYKYAHDALELNGAILKQMEMLEKEKEILITKAPKVDDGVNKLSEEEKMVIALHEAEIERKKVIISEEKRTRRLFGLLVKWEKWKRLQMDNTNVIKSPDGHGQTLGKRLFGNNHLLNPPIMEETEQSTARSAISLHSPFVNNDDTSGMVDDTASVHSSVTGVSQSVENISSVLSSPTPPLTATSHANTVHTNYTTAKTNTTASNTLKLELEEDENDPSRTVSKLDTLSFLLFAIEALDKGAGWDLSNDSITASHSSHSRRSKSRQTKSRSKQHSRHSANSKKDEKRSLAGTPTEEIPPQLLTSSSMSMLPPLRSAPIASSEMSKGSPALLKKTLSSKSMAATPTLRDANAIGGNIPGEMVAKEDQSQTIPVIEDPELGAMIDAAVSGNHSLPKDETGLTLLVLEDDGASVASSHSHVHTSRSNSPSRKGPAGTFALSPEDWELIRGIQWIAAVRDQLPLLDCLLHFPTSDMPRISRDELAQWATILVHVYPIFAEAVDKLNDAKVQAELALGVKTNKLSRNRHHRGANDAVDEEKTEEELAQAKRAQAELEEAKKRAEEEKLEEIRRTAEREKAWFMAHPHKYMHPKGQKDAPTFCLICHTKAHEYWLKCHVESEKNHQQNLEKMFNDIIEEKEEQLIDVIEKEQKSALENRTKALVEQALVREGVVKAEDVDPSVHVLDKDETNTLPANTEVALWEAKMQKIRAYLRRHNVPFTDPKGKALLPKKAPKKLRNINVRPKSPSALSGKTNLTMETTTTTSFVPRDEDIDIDPQDLTAVRARTALKFRVFHRDHETLEKSIFLGMCEFTAAELMDPPKGFRTFKLKPEPHFPDTENITSMIGGTIALMVRLTTQQKKDGGVKCNWRVTIKKVSKVPHVDKHRLTNPYVEVLWRGEAEKYQRPAFLARYALVAQSKTKFETVNAEFNDREYQDLSQFELPPLWTDLPIPHRGWKETDVCEEGGYIAKNWQALVEAQHAQQLSASSEAPAPGSALSLGTSGVPLNEIRRFRRQRQYKELLAQELKIAVEAERYILWLQEKERVLMAKEEEEQRCREDTAEQALYAEELAIQERFALDFQRLLELIVAPSPLLSRLRFLMGEQSNATENSNDDDNDKNNDNNNDKHNKDEDTARHKHTHPHAHVSDALLASLTATAKPFPKAATHRVAPDDTTANLASSTFSPSNLPSNHTPHKEVEVVSLSPEKTRGRKIDGAGSMRVLCEDPSTGALLRVVVLPILQPADETSIRSQATTIAGLRPCALTRILEVAVHDVRSYNAQGFTAVQERHAVVVMEYVNGATLGRHLFDHWDTVSPLTLRVWLTQITEALAYLHEQGVTHRNVSPQAFVVQVTQPKQQQLKRATHKHKRGELNVSLQASVTVRIQEYWFLENPRAANATHATQTMAMPQALGRGAWGCRDTAPPEVRNPALYQQQAFQRYKQQQQQQQQQQQRTSLSYTETRPAGVTQVTEMAYITDKADIFAFGACVFFWVTRGLTLPMEFFQHGNVEALNKFVPMKWRPWVMILLRMTLSLNPTRRASAQELTAFLSGDTGN